uniref:Uncharacterized protein n=1 Tax=Setaria viridis TaxID=4556 RepID=A0A4U6W6B7_SETVI|nr:hypothetical protein SEVIR_1G029460v2 [Setaria viridis]
MFNLERREEHDEMSFLPPDPTSQILLPHPLLLFLLPPFFPTLSKGLPDLAHQWSSSGAHLIALVVELEWAGLSALAMELARTGHGARGGRSSRCRPQSSSSAPLSQRLQSSSGAMLAYVGFGAPMVRIASRPVIRGRRWCRHPSIPCIKEADDGVDWLHPAHSMDLVDP